MRPLSSSDVVTLADLRAFRDPDLRLDDVDAGHLFGNGMFDLYPGVDLDEVVFGGVRIHQKLDRSRMRVVHRPRQLERGLAKRAAPSRVEVRRGGALDHLLVTPLHRAVALEEVHDLAMAVAQDLHLDMMGSLDEFLQVHLVVAEGRCSLAARDRQLRLEVVCRWR